MRSLAVLSRRKEQIAGYLFILPNLLGVLLFIFLPIAFSFALIFTDWDYLKGLQGLKWNGLGNFAALADDPAFLHSLRNTIYFTVVTVPVSIGIGLVLAVILERFVYYKNLIRTLFFLPYVSSVVAVGIIWSILYNSGSGPINEALRAIGISNPPGWLASPHWALPAIMIMTIWTYVGYAMVIYMAGVQGIPRDLYEAGDMDGASKLRQFFRITIPMLKPTSFLIGVTLVIASFQVFGAVAVMSKGGPLNSTMVLSYQIYQLAFQYGRMSYAATVSWVLFAIIFAVTLYQWRAQKKWQQYF
jgi:multiple sugar transport system permease protein